MVLGQEFWVQILVWKAGPSVEEAVSMLTDVLVGVTNLERQSAALFLAPEIHLKELMVISNNDVSALLVVIPLGYGVIDAIGFLFSSIPLPLGFSESV